jgi:hypothetical protein
MIKLKLKQIICMIVLVLSANLVSAITLDELIASYDFNYNDGNINLVSITQYGIDTNSNGFFDYLVLQINITNLEATYDFIADFSRNGKQKATAHNLSSIAYGANSINLLYNSKILNTGTYNVSLVINEDYFTHYRNLNQYTFYLDSSQYEQADISLDLDSHEFIDNDADGKYESLQVTTNIIAARNGDYRIRGYITDSESTVSAIANYSLDSGLNVVNLQFSGGDIWARRLKNARLYKIVVEDGEIEYIFPLDYTIAAEFDDFESDVSVFTGYFNDTKIDLDGNNLTDYLALTVGINAKSSGTFGIYLFIIKEDKEIFDIIEENIALHEGLNYAMFNISGRQIFNEKASGHLTILSAKLKQDNTTLDSLLKPYSIYLNEYALFEEYPYPDMTFTGFSVADDHLRSTIENLGEYPPFPFFVYYYNENFTLIYNKKIDYINPGQEEIIEFDFSENVTKIYAFIDYNNEIEETNESNNFYMLELSGANIINIYLIQGWNLISIPVVLDNKTIPAPFASIQGNYSSIFTYDAKTREWYSYNPTAPIYLNTLSSVDETQGIWINMQQSDILELKGTIPNGATFWLYQGWNLIGYPSLDVQDISLAFSNVNTSFSTIYKYDAFDVDPWKMYDITSPSFLIDLYTISPSYGYWVKMLRNTSWVFDGKYS